MRQLYFATKYVNTKFGHFQGPAVPQDHREEEAGPDEQLPGRPEPPDPLQLPQEGPHREDGDHREGDQAHPPPPEPPLHQGRWL